MSYVETIEKSSQWIWYRVL